MPRPTSRPPCKNPATLTVGKNFSIGNCAKSSHFSHCTVRTQPILAEVTMSELDLFIAALKFRERAALAAGLDRDDDGARALPPDLFVVRRTFAIARKLL